jgi:hypothetical protein
MRLVGSPRSCRCCLRAPALSWRHRFDMSRDHDVDRIKQELLTLVLALFFEGFLI